MSTAATAWQAAVTLMTLAVGTARVAVGLRPDRRPPRWLDVVAAVCVVAFLVAMAARLRTAL
ncbi:MAG: hypothetical protein JWN77_3131 [Frankiales bacterium]|jgi:hypothetical protein|nr:hypothetical protein [Frankiales bacterium]